VDDIYAEILALVFQHAHALRKPGRARLSTRLTALVRKHVDLYHNNRRARRIALVKKLPLDLRCEQLSAEELASMEPLSDNDSFGAWAKNGYARTECTRA